VDWSGTKPSFVALLQFALHLNAAHDDRQKNNKNVNPLPTISPPQWKLMAMGGVGFSGGFSRGFFSCPAAGH